MIPTMAFDSICRLCMKRDADFHSIFAESNNLCSKIMEISPKLRVFYGDGLPAQVCEKCLQRVDICCKFRLQCEESGMIPTMAFDICRLCMKTDADFHSIFAEPNSLYLKIMGISPKLQVFYGDGLPAQVCEKCLQQVDICYNFRLQCEESDTVFKHYLSSDLHNQILQDLAAKSSVTDAIGFGEECVLFKEESVMCVMEKLKKEPDPSGLDCREKSANENTKEDNPDLNHELVRVTKQLKQEANVSENVPDKSLTNSEVITYESRDFEMPPLETKNSADISVPQELDKSNEAEFREQSFIGKKEEMEDFKEEIYEVEELEYTKGNEYKCETCTKVFTSKETWEQHKCSTPYRCVICMTVLPGEGDLRAHMAKHEVEPCRICGRIFTVKTKYLSHMRVHGGIGPRCKYCNKVFPSLSVLKIHCRKHTGERPYVCEICGDTFGHSQVLKVHRRKHTGERPYICEFCGETFRDSHGHGIHLMRHTGKRPYQCHICLARFSANVILKDHIRTHTGEKPFVCEICGSKFRGSGGLRGHIKMVHAEKHFRFKCSWCHKEYTRNSHFKRHIRIHTGERPYECDICGKGFTQASILTRHLRTHTGEKSYNCTFCEKTFSSPYSRNCHLRIHTRKARFICATCDKAFSLKGDLAKHVFKFQH